MRSCFGDKFVRFVASAVTLTKVMIRSITQKSDSRNNSIGQGLLNLPVDIVINIFLRLPVEILMDCRKVCKVWCQIIDSPDFSGKHLSSYILIEPKLLYFEFLQDSTKVFSVKLDMRNSIYIVSEYPIAEFATQKSLSFESNYMGYGLFLFIREYQHPYLLVNQLVEILLYNPIRGEVLPLPMSTDYESGSFGLGFDSATNQYKLIYVIDGANFGRKPVGEVLTLGTSLWRKISVVPPFNFSSISVPAYGDIHWKGRHENDNVIVSFDVQKEELNLSPFPFGVIDDFRCNLFDMKGRLAIADGSVLKDHIDIWVVEDYEKKMWTKEYRINVGIHKYIIGAWADGLIFRGVRMDALYYYDPSNDGSTIVHSGSDCQRDWVPILDVIHGVNLVSLKKFGALVPKLAKKSVQNSRGN